MLPEYYNTTVLKPVSAKSANQIGPEREEGGMERGERRGAERRREEGEEKTKTKLVYTEKNTRGQQRGTTHFMHPGRVVAGDEDGGMGLGGGT